MFLFNNGEFKLILIFLINVLIFLCIFVDNGFSFLGWVFILCVMNDKNLLSIGLFFCVFVCEIIMLLLDCIVYLILFFLFKCNVWWIELGIVVWKWFVSVDLVFKVICVIIIFIICLF